MQEISFLFKEVITCGAVLSTFELVEALRNLGVKAHIISEYNNPELEDYFKIEIEREPKGITVAVSPKCEAEYAYVRTRDERWLKHKGKKIAVSNWIAEWLTKNGESVIVISNGVHPRFKNLNIERDIDILIEGNYEDNKNIPETIKEAKQRGGKIVWFGRQTIPVAGVESISSPKIQDIPILYNRAKTFIKKSKEEGWCRPVAEAQACGCEVINLNGGNREIEIVSWSKIANQFIKNIC